MPNTPQWFLKRLHPLIKDGIVNREACFDGHSDCCYRKFKIITSVCATRIQPGLTGISGKSNYRPSNLLFEPLLHKHRISPP